MQLSAPGTAFIAAHEGFVSKAYRCPAGVLTIGYGFTMGSKVFASYWRAKHGRALQMGDTITRKEADELLARMVDAEYGAAVNSEIEPKKQHHYDGASSMTFNCGPGALKWQWAKALAAGDVAEAAHRLRTTAVTANGRRLAGLVRRRDEEAVLIEHGRYAGVYEQASVSHGADDVREYQQMLADLGYDLVTVDGVPGVKTKAAVRQFQAQQNLVIDGVVGPATRAALIRALDAKRGNKAAAGAGAAGAGGGAVAAPDPASLDALWNVALYGIGAVLLVGAIVTFVRYRGRLTGRRVPT